MSVGVDNSLAVIDLAQPTVADVLDNWHELTYDDVHGLLAPPTMADAAAEGRASFLPQSVAGEAAADVRAAGEAAAQAPETTIGATVSKADVQAAQQALDAAQARVETLEQQWKRGYSFAPPPEGYDAAIIDRAKAQATLDAANGNRGAVILYKSLNSAMHSQDDVAAAVERLFGRRLTNDELAGLVGAPKGSFVTITGNAQVGGLSISLRSPTWDPLNPYKFDGYGGERNLYADDNGKLVMGNMSFSIDDESQRQGLGAQIFADQAQTLSDLGVSRIETFASGGGPGVLGQLADGTNGYYTWPRFGYLGSLPSESRAALRASAVVGDVPKAWGNYRTVQQLMRTPEGRAWWMAYGTSLDLTFDLTPGSLSMRVLDAYLREKGIK
jgi:GNAT superfamily N-acetyltransferase